MKTQAGILLGFLFAVGWSPLASAQAGGTAFKIEGKAFTTDQIVQEDPSTFYELESKKYEKIQGYARQKYLESFWEKKAKEQSLATSEAAMKKYMDSAVKVSEKDIKETIERFKDHPRLSKLSPKEQKEQVVEYLKGRAASDVMDAIIDEATKSGKLSILYPKPQEPIYQLSITKDDVLRYGPDTTADATPGPKGCKGDDCQITIIEYSEYQCPFCERVLPDVKKILAEYKGKIRWTVRDFPLSFHDRAKPAAIAARCAATQGKYWDMYSALFAHQRQLGDEDLVKYAQDIKLNVEKFKECTKNPTEVLKVIDANFESGAKLGVNGTPAFFINGRRLSGALPYAEFKRVIDEELVIIEKKKKS